MWYVVALCAILAACGAAWWWSSESALVARSEGYSQVAKQGAEKVGALEKAAAESRQKEHEHDVEEAKAIASSGDVERAIGFLVGVRKDRAGPGGSPGPSL